MSPVVGPVRASGNNFLAELVDLLAAMVVVPSRAPLWLMSDSKASIGATNKDRLINWLLEGDASPRLNEYAMPQRARILSAARPVMKMIRMMIEQRVGPVRLGHVRSHSHGADYDSRMNDVADVGANEARIAWAGEASVLPQWLWGEEVYRLRVDNCPVVSSFFFTGPLSDDKRDSGQRGGLELRPRNRVIWSMTQREVGVTLPGPTVWHRRPAHPQLDLCPQEWLTSTRSSVAVNLTPGVLLRAQGGSCSPCVGQCTSCAMSGFGNSSPWPSLSIYRRSAGWRSAGRTEAGATSANSVGGSASQCDTSTSVTALNCALGGGPWSPGLCPSCGKLGYGLSGEKAPQGPGWLELVGSRCGALCGLTSRKSTGCGCGLRPARGRGYGFGTATAMY